MIKSEMIKPFGVFVLGMHRSGTSTITHALQILGADLGPRLIAPATDNPDGFFENIDVVSINDALLDELGHAWDDFRPLPEGWLDSDAAARARALIVELYSSTFSQKPLWAIKDPRLCLTFPLWRQVFEGLGAAFGALLMVRDPIAIADSLRRRNGIGTNLSNALWLAYTRASCEASVGLASAVLYLDEFNQNSRSIFDALRKLADGYVAFERYEGKSEIEQRLDYLRRAPMEGRLSPRWNEYIHKKLSAGHLKREDLLELTEIVAENLDAHALVSECSAYLVRERSHALHDVRALLGALQSLQQEHEKVTAWASGLDAALIEANAATASWRSKHDGTIRSNMELKSRLEQALHDSSLNFTAARTLEERETELLQRYNRIIGSHSWKITKPLRFARRASSVLLKGDVTAIWTELTRRQVRKTQGALLRQHIFRKISNYANSRQNVAALNQLLVTRASVKVRPAVVLTGESCIAFDLSLVTYNSAKWLDRYFQSLIVCGYPLERIYIHVVDNGSNDDTLNRLREIQTSLHGLFGAFEVVVEANRGFGAGHDVNFRRCTTNFVLVSNVDLEFTQGSLSRLLAHARADEEEKFAAWEMCQAPYEHPKHYDPVSWATNWQAYACVLIRKVAYEQVGGFDKRIFMYCEDVELSYRFRSFGWYLMYCPDCVVIHHAYDSQKNLFKPMQFFLGTLGAGYVRMRYGTARDRLAGVFLHAWLVLRREQPLKDSRRALATNFIKLLRDAPHFLRGKGKSMAAFPFRGFDFEITRTGADLALFPTRQSDVLVSIITRTYSTPNRGILLRQAGMSICNQRHGNIEWIVVQDGGEDLKPIVDEISLLHPDLKVRFVSDDKLGRSHAGNVGLSVATGEYCMFLDDDDLLYADHCEVLVNCLMRDSSVSAAYALAFEVPTDISDGRIVEGDYISHSGHAQKWDYSVLQKYNFIPIQTILFRRKLFLERGGFNVALDQLEDWNLWLRYGYQNNFKFVRKTTSLYRIPLSEEKKAARQQLLHAAYEAAKADADEAIRALSGM